MTSDASGHVPEPGERKDADLFFPSEGSFSAVVPLSQVGRASVAASKDAPAVREPQECEEETLVPARRPRTGHDLSAKGVEQSWGLTAAALVLSVVAGLTAGAYLVWSRSPAEAVRADAHAEEVTDAVTAAEPASETPAPQAPPQAPQPDETRLAAEKAPAVAPPVRDASPGDETDAAKANAERAGISARSPRAAQPAGAAVTRTEAATRAERTERAAAEARDPAPAPRPARPKAATRRTASDAAARTAAPPERPLPISSPPPSANSRKVIKWP